MLEQLKYKNHVNEVFEFGKDGVFVNTNALHDYDWAVTQKNNRISALDRRVQSKKLPIVIICDTEAKATAAKNRMMEVMEKDVLALQHGQIIIGDYYFRCFVTKSQKTGYLTSKHMMTVTLTLTSDFPYWVKETPLVFANTATTGSGTDGLDYSFDYPFDYHADVFSRTLNNPGFVASNFRMHIYGACSNPAIYVAGHLYQVSCTVEANEYLTIDSVNKTITLTANDGTKTNVFNQRNRDSYIFEKIPPGASAVALDGCNAIDIILLEERSEPKWI